jgi:hypothetical protein
MSYYAAHIWNQLSCTYKDLLESKLFADRSFSVYGPKLWNSLPGDLQNIQSVSLFRSHLKTYLFEKAFAQYLN